MGLFDSFGDLFMPSTPTCKECRDADRGDVTMEYREAVWAPRLGATVDAYVCPECDHKVVAEDATMKEGTAGTAPDDSGGSGRYGVEPLGGGGFDDDDGWRRVR